MDSIYSIQVEKHVLGGLIKIPKSFADVERYITEKDFVNEVHQTVFRVLREVILDRGTVDTVILSEKIKNIGISFKDDINIYEYLEAISFSQITYRAIIEAAQELKKLTVRRELYHKCDEIKRFIKENGEEEIDSIVGEVDALYGEQLRSYEIEDEPINIFESMRDNVEERGNNPQNDMGIQTPYPEFNRLYGGLRTGNLYAIVARPGQGKTTWLNDLCFKTAKMNKIPVLILDTEMSSIDIQSRIASALTGVAPWYIETGNWRKNPELIDKVREGLKEVHKENLHHFFVGNKNIDQICSLVRRWHLTHVGRGNPFVLGYDYIKLTGEKVGNNWAEHQAIGDKIDKLKKLSEELECPLITAMQLNRSGENFNRRAGGVVDDSSAISLSDRLQWFASFVAIFRRKIVEEIAEDGEQFGTHKLIPLKTRFQGKDAAGHHDIVRRLSQDGEERWVNNYLNFNCENFGVTEMGSLRDVDARAREQYLVEGENPNDGDVI